LLRPFLLTLTIALLNVIPLSLCANKAEPIFSHSSIESAIQANASLLHHLHAQQSLCKGEPINGPLFENGDVERLWSRLVEFQPQAASVQEAFAFYYEGMNFFTANRHEEAYAAFDKAHQLLYFQWQHNLSLEEQVTHQSFLRNKGSTNDDFELNSVIPENIKNKMRPFVINHNHPMKAVLDKIFLLTRATINKRTFRQAGFKTLDVGPRSYVHVASHPHLPGYLVKAYMDNELKEKRKKPSWHWLVKRCVGARKVARIIESKNIRYFTVASKWIYPLPENPSPPANTKHTRHYALLLVTNMQLVPEKENYSAWKNLITPAHLDELYVIISRAKGSSYRPDNIAYTKKGTFAFIDTEYPGQGPDYTSIRHYLNPQMKHYWDHLVKTGGK